MLNRSYFYECFVKKKIFFTSDDLDIDIVQLHFTKIFNKYVGGKRIPT